MSFKNLIAVSAVALALAAPAVAAEGNFTGAYLGANVGYGAGKTQVDNKDAAPNNAKIDFGADGVVGGLHLGYQYQMGMMVVGAEGAFNMSNTEGKSLRNTTETSLKRKHAFGLAARLGAIVNSWMVYGKLGWENAKFEAKTSGNALAAANYSKNKRINGFVVGLGMETAVTKNIMLGGEWTYTMYKATNMSNPADPNPDSYKPRVGDFKVRLSYKF